MLHCARCQTQWLAREDGDCWICGRQGAPGWIEPFTNSHTWRPTEYPDPFKGETA